MPHVCLGSRRCHICCNPEPRFGGCLVGFEGLVLLRTLLRPNRSQRRAPNVRHPEIYHGEPGPGSASGWVCDLGESVNQMEQRLPTFLIPNA